jgi:hypothetical protein
MTKISDYTVLTPAYGKDYKNRKEVTEAFQRGKDFQMPGGKRGTYCSIRDFDKGCKVELRYKNLREMVVYTVGGEKSIQVEQAQAEVTDRRQTIQEIWEARKAREVEALPKQGGEHHINLVAMLDREQKRMMEQEIAPMQQRYNELKAELDVLAPKLERKMQQWKKIATEVAIHKQQLKPKEGGNA